MTDMLEQPMDQFVDSRGARADCLSGPTKLGQVSQWKQELSSAKLAMAARLGRRKMR